MKKGEIIRKEFTERLWGSIAIGLGVRNDTASGNREGGNYGWNFCGLEVFTLIGYLLAYDIWKKKISLYIMPTLMFGHYGMPAFGFGIALFRRIGIGILIPIEGLAFWLPPIVAVVISGIIAIWFLIIMIVILICTICIIGIYIKKKIIKKI